MPIDFQHTETNEDWFGKVEIWFSKWPAWFSQPVVIGLSIAAAAVVMYLVFYFGYLIIGGIVHATKFAAELFVRFFRY